MVHRHDTHDHHAHAHISGRIGLAFWLNTCFAIIEVAGGLYTNSVAILSDALHDFGDSLSLGLAWYFQKKSVKRADDKYSYGYRRFSVAGAFVNSLVLLVGSVFIMIEAVSRLLKP